jgi:hypothetical protein
MRIPIPKNKLVAFTLAGAVLTAVVAVTLAFPIPGVTAWNDTGDGSRVTSVGVPQATTDAPTPNQDFTPAVQTRTDYEDEEYDEYGKFEHEEHEDNDEGGEQGVDGDKGDDHEEEDDDDHEEE